MKNYERLENSATLGPHVFFKIYIRLRMDVSKYTDGDAALESPTWTSTVHRSPSRSDDHHSPATSSTPTIQAHSDADLFRLECSTPTGKRYNIWVTPTNNIAHVKLIIRGMTGMPTFNSALRVVMKGRLLSDDATMEECRASEGDVIHLYYKLAGQRLFRMNNPDETIFSLSDIAAENLSPANIRFRSPSHPATPYPDQMNEGQRRAAESQTHVSPDTEENLQYHQNLNRYHNRFEMRLQTKMWLFNYYRKRS
ncbi:hypothetical protein PROFUN_10504 [Planoprotostelium fungivorum]|uniref:Ubiquitin-like domain-containing protein n=1 Tax=Planoprotostelium fungivorum TaxID=1890364 RepID=A0A2P6NDD0_9EUKA|nr:hypothetical protein PROFUN_10504 [Planoprotostelium fungivorum]